jgi:hypothetical protein
MSTTDYDRTWEDVWKPFVTLEDGSVNLDAVKRELHDYHLLMNSVSAVYWSITDGLISKPGADPYVVLSIAQESEETRYRDWLADEITEFLARHGIEDPR